MVVCRDGWSLWEIEINGQDSGKWRYLTTEGLPSEANIFRSLDDQSRCVNYQQWGCYHGVAVVRAQNILAATPGFGLPLSVAEIKGVVRCG
jgi:hypothetical protein